MGIPNLSRHLASLSEPIVFGGGHDGSSVSSVRSVVIDGPSLVYHVHSILASRRSSRLSQIDRQPSCNEVSVAVMNYLVLLKVLGVSVLKIYFDGALPLNKRETRLSRLEKSRKQLEMFCKATSKESGLVSVDGGAVAIRPRDLFQGFESVGKRSKLPENAFMVSAVIEDLVSRWNSSEIKSNLLGNLANFYLDDTNHPWSDICEIVPGEADIACAALAYQEPGLAILTSDSDLLVYDFGSTSSVIFFNTISTENWYDNDPSQSTVKAMSVSPGSVSRRLGIPALSYFAYELSLDPHAGFRELIRRAKRGSEPSQPVPAAYIEFMRQYDFQRFQNGALDPSLLRGIDVRLSELLAQCFWAAEYLEETPRIYLPFLQEDHSRRCGWAEGSRIRRLAFSLLNFNTIGVEYTAITECTRRGTRFCFDQVALYTHETVDSETQRLVDIFNCVQAANPLEHGSPIFWRIFAIAEMHLNATETLPSRLDKQVLANFLGVGKTNTNRSRSSSNSAVGWEEIHALAQMQSVLYSLRMLSQIITTVPHSQGLLGQLHGILSTLPPLHVLMRSYREVRDEFYYV
ncbi:hypothetical protein PISL3812_05761 [Talaromyces islandicus]|uniref:Asteroid domain-containing protein n=1 Tax=Talaromyces islandicus TaxID=28573 RepID=A0A0U1LZI7_TALIS|nr:hypothetical protein PISL3812_05761 [Talaromyces islandicus]